jgi:hypothetical protein
MIGLLAGSVTASAADRILEHLGEWSPAPDGMITTAETAKEIAVAVWRSAARVGFGVSLDRDQLTRSFDAQLDGAHWIVRMPGPKPETSGAIVSGGGVTIVLSKIDGRIEGIFLSQ